MPRRIASATMSPAGMPFARGAAGEDIVAAAPRFADAFAAPSGGAGTITLVPAGGWDAWVAGRDEATRRWVAAAGMSEKKGGVVVVPRFGGDAGGVEVVWIGLKGNVWEVAKGMQSVPAGLWKFVGDGVDWGLVEVGWALGAYQFGMYKKGGREDGRRVLERMTDGPAREWVDAYLGAAYFVRDIISTPTEDLGPVELASAAQAIAGQFGATCDVVVGDDLLKKETYFPQVHIVGRAATPERQPRLIDLRWKHGQGKKRVTLVGKGVVYDTGGLSMKPTSGMLSMKKDMGGGAHVLGLAYMIMKMDLDVDLRVLVPAVENSVGPDSYRPGDVIVARNNLTTEVTNTDAEGRLVLADALVAACEDKPDILIDFATLTGAQRVALGPDVPSFWVGSDEIAADLASRSVKYDDLMWRLPMYQPYRSKLDSAIADIKNSCTGYGGAITAALYLKEFVTEETTWIHVDLMAYNATSKPGRPEGGEAMGLRAVYSLIADKFVV